MLDPKNDLEGYTYFLNKLKPVEKESLLNGIDENFEEVWWALSRY